MKIIIIFFVMCAVLCGCGPCQKKKSIQVPDEKKVDKVYIFYEIDYECEEDMRKIVDYDSIAIRV